MTAFISMRTFVILKLLLIIIGILTSPWNIMLTIMNKVDSNIIVFSSDNDPPQGFKIKKGYVVSLSKTLSSKQNIRFWAIEDPSRAKVSLNGKEGIEITGKQGKPSAVVVTMTGKTLSQYYCFFPMLLLCISSQMHSYCRLMFFFYFAAFKGGAVGTGESTLPRKRY